MPESIATSMVLNRIEDETLNVDEGIIKFLFSADIVKIIHEVFNFDETDNFRYAWGWAVDEAVNLSETYRRILLTIAVYIVKVISEVLDVKEQVYRRLSYLPDLPIIQVIDEILWFNVFRTLNPSPPPTSIAHDGFAVRALLRIRTERQQISEIIITDILQALIKITNETLDISETAVNIVSTVINEIVKVVSETLSSTEDSLYALIYVLGLVRVVNEQLLIYEPPISALTFIIGQLAGLFKIESLLRGVFRINQDVEQ